MVPVRSSWGRFGLALNGQKAPYAAAPMALTLVTVCILLSTSLCGQTIRVSGRARIYPINGAPIDADSWWQEESIIFYKIGETILGMPRSNVDRIEGLPPLVKASKSPTERS